MRRLWLLLAVTGVGALAAVAFAAKPPALAVPAASAGPLPRLGILQSRLVRIDPRTLRVRTGRQLPVGTYGFAWSFSRDGSRLALGGDVDYGAGLLVVDARRLRTLGRVRLAQSGWVRATTWLSDGRIAAVVSVLAGGRVRTDVVTVDGSGRKVLRRQSFPGQILRVARTGDGLVVLRGAAEALEPARLTIVDATGAASEVVIDGIVAGSEPRSDRNGAEFSQREPGLAVDAVGGKAFVIDGGGEVAEVDLASRGIAYHHLSRARSFLARVHDWLEPAAAAKSFEGPSRVARWLGGGVIGVSGGDYSVVGKQLRFQPLGLELVDTRTWSARRLGRGTDAVWPAGDTLLAAATTSSGEVKAPRPPGLVAYGPDGRQRFRLFDGRHAWLVYADARRAYVWVARHAEVVDLASGRVLERRSAIATPLLPPGPPTES